MRYVRLTAVRQSPPSPLRSLRHDSRGSVLVLFALALVTLLVGVGLGIDYVRAMRAQTKLAAIADAAALTAVSQDGMAMPPATAETAIRAAFVAQARSLEQGGLLLDYQNTEALAIGVVDTPLDSGDASGGVSRRATVAFRARHRNVFAGILGLAQLPLQGVAGTTASTAPNIDLYVLVDTSPSMLLPASDASVRLMVAATGGCAFACHETGSTRSNLSIARSRNISLRYDVVLDAVRRLTTLARDAAANTGVRYRIGLHDFDYKYRQIWPRSPAADGSWVDSNLDQVRTHVADAQPLAYCRNSERVCGVPDADTATDFTAALNGINASIPTPGDGSNRPGDRPRAVVLLVTDGMRDEWSEVSGRLLGPVPVDRCDEIKRRGVRLAILNAVYLPASIVDDEWSRTNVLAPFLQPNDVVSPALQSCASPGLYHEVTLGDDLSSSVAQLFQKSIKRAFIMK